LRFLSLFILLTLSIAGNAQHYTAKSLVDTLCSPTYFGRGYVQDGALKAANFIAKTFKEIGLKPGLDTSFYSTFNFTVNTFPKTPVLKQGNKVLILGKDYIPSPYSGTTNGVFKVQAFVFDENWTQDVLIKNLRKLNPEKITLVQKHPKTSSKKYEGFLSQLENTKLATPFILEKETLTGFFTDAHQNDGFIYCKADLLNSQKPITLSVENKVIERQLGKNVIAKITGTSSDSCYVITGHYDHLGGWGNKVYVPGANDNASGISFIMQLAQTLVNKELPYDVYFITFSAEEVGLLGSKAFVDNHLKSIPPIKTLLNFDLLGTGSEGICVVNATEFPTEYTKLEEIIKAEAPAMAIQKRGKAANSDHYWFSEAGVPSFFIYTKGGSPAYHHIDDMPSNLTYEAFPSLLNIVERFISTP